MNGSSPPNHVSIFAARVVTLLALVVVLAACGTATGQPTAGAQAAATASATAPRSPAPTTTTALATPPRRPAASASVPTATVVPTTSAPSPTLRLVTPGVSAPTLHATPVLVPTLAATPTPFVCLAPLGTPSITPEPEATCADALKWSSEAPPSFLLVEAVGGVLVVQWDYTGVAEGHYDVYRQTMPDGAWQQVGSVGVVAAFERPPISGAYAWRDSGAQAGMTYRYGVVTVNNYGVRSSMMISAPVTAP